MLTLGLRIKKIREMRGYSQDFMALKLKISQEHYSYLENKQKHIPEEHMHVIAELLEVTIEDIRSFDPGDVIKNTNLVKSHESEIEAYRQLIKTLSEEIVELRERLK